MSSRTAPQIRAPTPPPRIPRERPLSDLIPNSIYITLKLRDPSTPSNFHWALYVHRSASLGGTKYHITGSTGHWHTDHNITFSTMKEFCLIGLIRVASFKESELDPIDKVVREEDEIINDIERITCRVWIGRVCERLKEAGVMGFESWEEVEEEAMGFGNEGMEGCNLGLQPRPVMDSRVCRLR